VSGLRKADMIGPRGHNPQEDRHLGNSTFLPRFDNAQAHAWVPERNMELLSEELK